MIRMNFFLLVAVLASAMYLVGIQYESRNLYAALDEAQREIIRLEADRDRLQVERRSNAWHANNCKCASRRPVLPRMSPIPHRPFPQPVVLG